MTTPLDDGLNTSTPLFNPASIRAEWLELPPGYAENVTIDSVQELGEQVGPSGLEVTQSFDDGLPDPVTMTSGNDASGSLNGELVGRPSLEALESSLVWSVNSGSGGGGPGIAIAVPMPAFDFLDYTIVTVAINSNGLVQETSIPANQRGAWKLLADVQDEVATPYRLFVFGRLHYSGAPAPSFTISKSSNWAYGIAAVKAGRTAGGAYVTVEPNRAGLATEGAVAVTSHTTAPVTLNRKGFNFVAFLTGGAAGPWTLPAEYQLIGGSMGALAFQTAYSPLRTVVPQSYSATATTALATATAAMVNLPFEVHERSEQDAAAYFSPFNPESPVYGFERDTASMTSDVNVVTPQGNVATRVFTGIMEDIPVTGRTASIDAVSLTRLRLDDSFKVPTVSGPREGASTDWLAGFILANGGQYTGVCPGPNTRFWAPMHGSLHPWMDGPASFPSSYTYTTARTPGTAYTNNNIRSVDGPFVTGVYAQMKSAEVISNSWLLDTNWATAVPGVDSPLTYDIHSKKNSVGRLSFRMRCDPFDAAPAALAGGEDFLFDFAIWNQTDEGNAANSVRLTVNSNLTYTVWVGNSMVVNNASFLLPTDGQWHFFGFAWNFAIGEAKFRRDGAGTISLTGFAGNQSQLPNSQEALYGEGLFTGSLIRSRLPLSELQVEIGPEVWTPQPWNPSGGGWQWMGTGNPPGLNSLNATYRPTKRPLAAIAIPAPVQGWGILQEIAQSTLSWLRINEADNVEMVPLSYFGETAQMTVTDANILDTKMNAADLEVISDATKTRNIVTMEFEEVRVDSARSSVLESTSAMTIPKGESFQTFALDVLIAETHGAASWQSNTPNIVKLTAQQIAGTVAIPNEHVMTVNLLPDGKGTVVAASVVQARIVSWDCSTVTIRFRNNWPAPVYLINDGDQIPTLRILGYAVRASEAYTTVRDPGSIGLRRPRGLTSEFRWVQDRATSLDLTTQLVSLLARPRPQVKVTVMGDPRRRPGMLIRLVDASGTKADGTWRILAIKHRINGAMYVNDLELVRIGETGVWDVSLWDNAVWGV